MTMTMSELLQQELRSQWTSVCTAPVRPKVRAWLVRRAKCSPDQLPNDVTIDVGVEAARVLSLAAGHSWLFACFERLARWQHD